MNSIVTETYLQFIRRKIFSGTEKHLYLQNVKASYSAFICLGLSREANVLHILPDEEQALASFNELHSLDSARTFFFPALYQRNGEKHKYYEFNWQQRTEALEQIVSDEKNKIVVTYYDAITEPVSNKDTFKKNQFVLHQNENVSYNFLLEFLREYGFEKNEFVYFPGQYSVRGSIIDVYSYSNEYPVRIEFRNNTIFRLSEFHPASQMSFRNIDKIHISPKLEISEQTASCIVEYFSADDFIVLKDVQTYDKVFENAEVLRISEDKIFNNIKEKKNYRIRYRANVW